MGNNPTLHISWIYHSFSTFSPRLESKYDLKIVQKPRKTIEKLKMKYLTINHRFPLLLKDTHIKTEYLYPIYLEVKYNQLLLN